MEGNDGTKYEHYILIITYSVMMEQNMSIVS
jgi:hypothetical protein